MKPQTMWAVTASRKQFVVLVARKRGIAVIDAVERYGMPWDTLRKRGWRVVKVEVREVE